ncbi:purine-binding chemotaxis protein CheW [Palleronia aestuarii]|uniref:Purine-binding chemotaxis protein CheW n=1 Tax=Palleronia aestuarii TaxID=568105 RepID=A0A2W7N3E9_9RHOB|nr:chemotaxis protein CheW [Palleronia aestuarii]PZX11354.1 purine-binding chemotaxis protein CheW [Palleronia aestuarii]
MSTDEVVPPSKKREFLNFYVGGQEFCMDIMPVREICSWTNVTTLPHAPVDVLGVMNLRGAIVPIVDLSARLGLGPCERHERNVIIIAMVSGQVVGLLVTAVSDIVEVGSDEIQPMPRISCAEASDFIAGIISSREHTLRVLSTDALAASMTAVRAVA